MTEPERVAWQEVSIGDIADVNPESVRGWDNSRKIRYVEISCVSADLGIDLSKVNELELSKAPSSAKRIIREDDVIISNVRPNLRAFALVPPELDGEVATTGFTVLRARDEMAPEYLWALASSEEFARYLTSYATGSTYPTVNAKVVQSYTFQLPPLAEQKRIAEVIESTDAYINTLHQSAEVALTMRQALIAELLTPPPPGSRMEEGSSG